LTMTRRVTLVSCLAAAALLKEVASIALTPHQGQRVLLVGPGFLQLNIAKQCKAAGIEPVIVAPQAKLDKFANYINDDEIMASSSIGIPDEKNTIHGVVFCSEEAVFGPDLIQTVLEWEGCYATPDNKPLRAVACAPLSTRVNQDKSMGWMPIFNSDNREKAVWDAFVTRWKEHPISSSDVGTLVRFGSLLGGSTDGIDELKKYGLDERIYKMSLENYRDLKERSFDRFRLGAQILEGDAINVKPAKQDKLEREAIKNDEELETFRITGFYPEQDRTNRHTMAQAVVQTLLRPNKGVAGTPLVGVPKEFTVLSKSVQALPTQEEWDQMFENPGPAEWPLPMLV